jgi:hypothetical protein
MIDVAERFDDAREHIEVIEVTGRVSRPSAATWILPARV